MCEIRTILKKHIHWICFLVAYFVVVPSVSRDQRSFRGNISYRIRTIGSLFGFRSSTNNKIRFSIFPCTCFVRIGLSVRSITSWSCCSRWIEYFCWNRHVFKNIERNTTRRIFSWIAAMIHKIDFKIDSNTLNLGNSSCIASFSLSSCKCW